MNINVTVVNQKLNIATELKRLVSGTNQFICFNFKLPSDWDHLTCVAQFMQEGMVNSQGETVNAINVVLDSQDKAYMSPEVGAGKCTMMLYGSDGNVKATTNFIEFTIDESRQVVGSESHDWTPGIYEQICDYIDDTFGQFVDMDDEEIRELISNQITDVITDYINSDEFVQRTIAIDDNSITNSKIADGTISRSKVNSAFEATLAKADTALQSIVDGSISREMVDAEFEATLAKADTAMQSIPDASIARSKVNAAFEATLAKADASSATVVVSQLPSSGYAGTDYILADNGLYMYYKYINNAWQLISGGTAEIITQDYNIDYFEHGDPEDNDYVADESYVGKYYLDIATLTPYTVVSETETVDEEEVTTYSWEAGESYVESPSEFSDYYIQFNGGDILHFRYVSDEFIQVGSSSSTQIVTELPQSGFADVDYILVTNGEYQYYKYLDNDWRLISGGGGEIITAPDTIVGDVIFLLGDNLPTDVPQDLDEDYTYLYVDTTNMDYYSINETVTPVVWVRGGALVETPSQNKDYYITDRDGKYCHFRYNGSSFVQVGSSSYNKNEVDVMLNVLNGRITALSTRAEGFDSRITSNQTNITQLNNVVTTLQEAVNNIDVEGYEYYADYGTYEVNGEEQPNVFRLRRVKGEEEVVVSSFRIEGGGGGGQSMSTNLVVERITPSPLIVTPSDRVILQFKYSSVTNDEQQEEIDGTYTLKLGNMVIASGACMQGENVINSIDVTDYCLIGTQKFNLNVVDEGGSMAVRTFTVQKVDVRLESDFNDKITYSAGRSVNFTYTPYGSISKTVHFKLDDVELNSVTTSASGILQSYSLLPQTHGAHMLECWITAVINGVTIETSHVFKDIIWYDETSNVPIIGCIYRCLPVASSAIYDENIKYYYIDSETGLYSAYEYVEDEWDNRPQLYYRPVIINQYDSITIDYVVYNPNSGLPTVVQRIDGIASTRQLSTYQDAITYKSPMAGVHSIILSCEDTSIALIIDVQELDIDVSPITANLAFDFNPVGYSNTSENRIWVDENDENIAMSVSNNFDWSNGGYQIDQNGDQYFCIKAGTTASFSYNLFGVNPKNNGAHFKLIFKTQNVSNINTNWMSCYDNEVGIQMNAHSAKFMTSVAVLDAPYSENDIIEFEYNIQTLNDNDNNATSLIMIYEDGVGYRPMVYDSNHRLYQYSPVGITFGSTDCDVLIYRMKAYTASLTDKDTISNFIADATNAEEMIARYNRNQIYDDNNKLTPESLADACPDLRVIKIECPKFTNNKSETITDTIIQCIYKNGDPVLDNWTARNCSHSGQGTTSNEYGIAGRNMDLKMNLDDTVIILGDGTTESSGKVSLSRTSVPNNYFNVKVNIASSENANNALLANRYDRFLPYSTPAKLANPFVKTTMEFVNCAIFIKENDTDLSTHREFNDNDWHFYGIGNIGDSKKTDKTRVHDKNDMKEFVNEILDNTLPNSIFDTGVYNLIVEQLPTTGDLFTDYYIENNDGTYTLNRYLDDEWVTISNSINEIQNGAVAIVSSLPQYGIINIEYYIGSPGNYLMYTWDATENDWSDGTERTEISNRHMATAISPEQFVAGNAKYDSLYSAEDDGKFSDTTCEMRYEPKNISNEQHEANKTIWRDMYTWVITSTDEEFVNEFDNWFIKDAFLYYYLFTERYTMTDNRAKNSFWHWGKFYISTAESVGDYASVAQYYTIDDDAASINDGYRFDLWDYDNDTSLGINNSGDMVISYGKEDIDFRQDGNPNSGYTFNGAESVIFRRIRLLMHSDLVSMYQNRESAGCWTSSSFISEFDNWQLEWPEELWRLDIERKYIRPYLGTSIDGSIPKTSDRFLKTMMNGRKKYHRRQFERDQSVYIGTKYLSSAIRADQIMFRCNTPRAAVVQPDYTLRIVPYSDMYLSVMYGNTVTKQTRAKAGNTYVVNCPLDDMDETAVLIYAASRIQAINDLSACYIQDNDFSNAEKLQTLVIGNTTSGYSNTFLTTLTIGNNTLLKSLDIRNCPNLTGSLNLSRCDSLLSLRAEGTSLTGVMFATNGKVNEVYLPNTITSLTMRNLNYLTTVHNNLDNLQTLTVENGIMDTLSLIQNTYDTVQELRLVGIDWILPSSTLLNSIYAMNESFLSGQVYVNGNIRLREISNYENKWNDLNVTYNPEYLVEQFVATYVNYDSTQLCQVYVDRGSIPPDPTLDNTIPIPTKPSDAQYNYTFSGWDNITSPMNSARTITAQYSSSIRTYTVNWYSRTGVLLETQQKQYGQEAVYTGDLPTRTDGESSLEYYVFTGWDKSTGYITGNTDVYATWDHAFLPTPPSSPSSPSARRLNDMTLAEIYGIGQSSHSATEYFEEGDYVDIEVGNDFTFSNVESEVLCENQWFNGEESNCINTGIKLFNPDSPSFTLAIDYEFYSTDNGQAVIACYNSSQTTGDGFILRYTNNPVVEWAGQTQQIGTSSYRNICVIRHQTGSRKLLVYYYNTNGQTYEDTISFNEVTAQRDVTIDLPLIIGGSQYIAANGSIFYRNPYTGWIHWCKIWYQDLGDANARELAAWPHETWRANYYNGNRRYEDNWTGEFHKMAFILNNALGSLRSLGVSSSGGWPSFEIRNPFFSNKLYNAFPVGWRSIMKEVRVKSNDGTANQEIVTSGGSSGDVIIPGDKIFIPSISEVTNSYTYYPYSSEGFLIPFLDSSADCIKFMGQIVPENYHYFNSSTDPTLVTANNVQAGDIWYKPDSPAKAYIYIPPEVSSKHIYHSVDTWTSGTIVDASTGGIWYPSTGWFTRSPYYQGEYQYWDILAVSNVGNSSQANMYGSYALVPCFVV